MPTTNDITRAKCPGCKRFVQVPTHMISNWRCPGCGTISGTPHRTRSRRQR